MKFIGQNIQDFISRFRNDVFLESISSGTIASGGNLGLDANNKIVKAAVADGDITGVTAGTGLSGGGTTGTVTLNVSGLTISEFAGASLTTSSESFADNDTTLMTSAAINDLIGAASISGVRLTADDSNTASDNSGSADFIIAGGAGIGTTISGNTVNINLDVSDLVSITSLTGLTTIGTASRTTNIAAGDLTMYNAVNDGNPTISLGSSATERLEIQATYESGAQGLDVVKFITHTAGASANDSRYAFQVDETFILNIKDNGLQLKASGELEIGSGNTILSDSSGTTTLSNIDAIDATTESTIETAIDTLSNLTSASSLATIGTITSGTWRGTVIENLYTSASAKRYGTYIKILPSDFMINDDAASPLSFKDGSNSGVHVNDSASEAICFIPIPEGMKATHVDIYGTHNKTIKVWEVDVDSSFDFTSATKGTGSMNTTLAITEVNATADNYLAIQVTLTATSQRIWGGKVTIASQ